MSRLKIATAAYLASSATAAGVFLCALAAGKRSRPEAECISEDEAQMASLTKAREAGERRRAHCPPAPSLGAYITGDDAHTIYEGGRSDKSITL